MNSLPSDLPIIAEEKDRGTLEFLLATDLRNSEIVLSKFVARLGNLHPAALLLMTAAWWVYAAVLAEVGLWFSLSLGSSSQHTLSLALAALHAHRRHP